MESSLHGNHEAEPHKIKEWKVRFMVMESSLHGVMKRNVEQLKIIK
jgi:hypothetical protein